MRVSPVIVLLLLHVTAYAQDSRLGGDARHGEDIVRNGTPPGAAACVSCHGLGGEGDAKRGYPRLALLNADYLVHQLRSFKDGTRKNPVMQPIVAGLSDRDMADVAAWYSKQRVARLRLEATGEGMERGARLAGAGDPSRALPACFACHGSYAEGNPPAFPRLAGQFSGYLFAQLQAFKSGQRHNDPGHFMQAVAQRLSPQDMRAVADYLAHLSPPARSPANR